MPLPQVTRRDPVTPIVNPHGPIGANLLIAYAFDEGSGAALDNLVGDANYDATLLGSPSWVTDSDEQAPGSSSANAVRLDGASQAILVNTASTDQEFARGTICIRFGRSSDTVSNLETLLNSGAATAVAKTLQIAYPAADDVIRVIYRDAGLVQHFFEWSRTGEADQKHTLIVTWGERGFYAWVDGQEPEAYFNNASNGGEAGDMEEITPVPEFMDASLPTSSVVCTGDYFNIGRNQALNYALFDLMKYYHWTEQPELIDVEEITADPKIPIRNPADTAHFEEPNGWMYDLDADGSNEQIKIRANIDSGASGSPAMRFTYSTDPLMADGNTSTSDVPDGSGGDALTITLDGLSTDTQYYGFLEQFDSTGLENPTIFAGGRMRFKTRGGDPSIILMSDAHVSVKSGETNLQDDRLQISSIVANSVHSMHKAIAEADEDVRCNSLGVHLIVTGGDEEFPDGADDATEFRACYPRYRIRRNKMLRCAPVAGVRGNHECEGYHYRHAGGDESYGGQQMLATIYRKKFLPGKQNGEGGSYDTTSEWLGSETDSGEAYWTDIQEDTTDNSSPLENFWSQEIGDLLICGLDVYRYPPSPTSVSASDSEHGEHFRENPEFTFGTLQKAWLEATLAAHTGTHKILVMHNLPGGEEIRDPASAGYDASKPCYGWGSGRALSTADELWLLAKCKQYRVNAVFMGHAHCFEHVVFQSVNFITIPSTGAPSLINDGWNYTSFDASYGDSFDEGGLSGVLKRLNIYGYLKLALSGGALTLTVRETSKPTGASDYANFLDNGASTAQFMASQAITVTGSGPYYAELSERPKQVYAAIDDADYVDGFWTTIDNATDNLHTPVGSAAYLGAYPSATIEIDADVSAVRIAATPSDVYTAVLNPASPSSRRGRSRMRHENPDWLFENQRN